MSILDDLRKRALDKMEVLKPQSNIKINYNKGNDDLFKHKKGDRIADECFIVIPDVHSYARDEQAYELCMESVKVLSGMYNVTKIVQLGDLMECGEASSYGPSHLKEEQVGYLEEVDFAIDFWKRLRKYNSKAELVGHLGNHEHRVNSWLMKRMGFNQITQSIYDELNPTKFYEKLGVKVIPYANENPRDGMYDLIPNVLTSIHGWFTGTGGGIGRKHLVRIFASTSLIFGHTHQISTEVLRNASTGKCVGAYNIGCLARSSMWWHKGVPMNHGLAFALVLKTKNDNGFSVNTLNILGNDKNKYVILPNGAILNS